MSSDKFNICPSCVHRDVCVLTLQKEKVWSCSEYDLEETNTKFVQSVFTSEKKIRKQF